LNIEGKIYKSFLLLPNMAKKGWGTLFIESWGEYFKKFLPILKIFLLFYLLPFFVFALIAAVFLIAVLGTAGALNAASDTAQLENTLLTSIALAPLVIIVSIFLLVMIVLGVFMNLGLIHIGFTGEKSTKRTINTAKKYFWPYFGLSVLLFFALVGLYILLIIPGVIFTIYWIFSPYILVKEKTGIMESLRRSMRLVKKFGWWRTFGYVLLFGIILWVITIILQRIPIVEYLYILVTVPVAILFYKNVYLKLKGDTGSVGEVRRARVARERK